MFTRFVMLAAIAALVVVVVRLEVQQRSVQGELSHLVLQLTGHNLQENAATGSGTSRPIDLRSST